MKRILISATVFDMTGEEFKKKREEFGMSREELAVALKVGFSTITRIESAKDKEIPNARLYELAFKGLEAEKKSLTNPLSTTPTSESEN